MGGPFCVYLSSRDDAADASEISLASSLKLVRARSDKQVKASLKSNVGDSRNPDRVGGIHHGWLRDSANHSAVGVVVHGQNVLASPPAATMVLENEGLQNHQGRWRESARLLRRIVGRR